MADQKIGAFLYRRFVGAFCNSANGLIACFREEEAFRFEVLLAVFLLPAAAWLATDALQFVMLVGSVMLVLIAELLNSGIEAIVDRVGLEHHELSGRAKDMGSAAVLLAMLLFLVTWVTIIAQNYR